MRTLEFECRPSVCAIFESIDDSRRFLLEDIGGGTALIGAYPQAVLISKGGVTVREQADARVDIQGDLFGVLDEQLRSSDDNAGPVPSVPFAGGAVGYFSYDLGRTVEEVPRLAQDDLDAPDYCLGFYDSALSIDLERGRCTAVSWSGDRAALEYWRDLALSLPMAGRMEQSNLISEEEVLHGVRSNFTKPDYLAAISRVKEYITAGDVYQVNLAQRFEAELGCSGWSLYKVLRRINPAPKSCYMEIGPLTLVSASPETFLTYDPVTRIARTRPIKGTRPRSNDPIRDEHLARELANSEKDRAENLMIVDMLRNDLGRVAEYGTVKVSELWGIERHPNVFQMVSTVEAELARNYGPIDLLRSCFPGGSITGAPKVRAMEIIEELEPHRRGIYTGAAGFIDFRGNVDLNIVIRSLVVSGSKAYFHGGGGIVIDSDPEMEYMETLHKVAGLVAALRECEVNA